MSGLVYTIDLINSLKPADSRLTAISFYMDGYMKKAFCNCSCGKTCYVTGSRIVSGHTKSCGCYNIDKNKEFSKYSHSIPEIYHCWWAMNHRCDSPDNPRYHVYGGIGVTVCEEWKHDYQKFLDWALSNGWKKGLQLDKDIKGTGLLYCPEYCCFVTPKENANKRTTCVYYEYNGQTLSFMQICELEGLKYESVRHHIRHGNKSIYEAISIVKNRNK